MDVAALSLNVDSSKVLKAANDLDRFSEAANRAGAAGGSQSGSIAKLVATVQAMDAKLASIVGSLDKIARATKSAAVANDNMASSTAKAGAAVSAADAHVIAYTQHLTASLAAAKSTASAQQSMSAAMTSSGQAFANANAHVTAYNQHLQKIAVTKFPSYGASMIRDTGQAAQIASHHAMNLGYQLNDVFVSLASGQNPMTVFIQQGAQIGQIYGQTGLTVKGFSLAIANMTGIIRTTTAAQEAAALAAANQMEASVAAANAQAAANVRAAETNIMISRTQVSMAATATEATLANARLAASTEALAAAQAEAAITSRALATAQKETAVAAEAAAAVTTTSLGATGMAMIAVLAVVVPLTAGIAALTAQANDDSGLKKYTKAMGYTKEEVKKLNAVTVTFGDTMRAVFQVSWERIADAFGVSTDSLSKKWNEFLDLMQTATRATFAGLYATFTGGFYALNQAIEAGKKGQLANPVEGFRTAYNDAQKFMDDVVSQAGANARARQAKMAKDFYDKPSAGKHVFDFSDILKDADKLKRGLEAAKASIGLYGEELARVNYESDLFNKAADNGLKLTEQQKSTVRELSAELAKLAEANRLAMFREETKQGALKQLQALKDAAAQIGVYNQELAALRYEQEMLNKAVAEHITLTDKDREKIRQTAEILGGKEYANTLEQSRVDNARWHAEQMRQLDVERGALGLTGEALIAYNYQQELINKALQAGVQMKDIDIEKTRMQAEAYANVRDALDKQTKAMEDAREVTRGFFSDWINGVREGGNLFKSFADSVINSLNRIIDKLLDRTLNGFLDSMFSGGSGGILGGLFGGGGSSSGLVQPTNMTPWEVVTSPTKYAKGAAFGAANDNAIKFAKGGAFTNRIVNTPTLFRFANGAKMGEMGEAGPEAIMPLTRGPNGKLGVRASGGGRPSISIGDINQNINIDGGFTPESAIAMIRQGGQEVINEVRRNLDTYLREWDTDGAVAA